MGKKILIVGRRFGRLLVTEAIYKFKEKTRLICRCDCGVEKVLILGLLTSGHTKSCGCLKLEMMTEHGHSKNRQRNKVSTEYRAWYNMKNRCYNSNSLSFKYYGAKGVIVCDRWISSFENFLADMGEKPTPKHTIEREDVEGNYEPSNCRWATYKEQARNKRATIRVFFKGEIKSLAEWAEILGFKLNNIYMRYKKNGTQDFDKPMYWTYPWEMRNLNYDNAPAED